MEGIKNFFWGFSLLLVADLATAQGLILGEPSYGGTGCPAGSASVSISPDQAELSILFDQYIAEAGESSGLAFDRKSCNLSVPVYVPNGYSVAIFRVDYRGFNAISTPSGWTQFNTEYFWAGVLGPQISRNFGGPLISDYTLTDDLTVGAMIWTPCGDSINLRVNSSAVAVAGADFGQTMITVDSADVSSGLIYHLQWRQCQ